MGGQVIQVATDKQENSTYGKDFQGWACGSVGRALTSYA